MTKKLIKAIQFATHKHNGQTRDEGGEIAYIVHPLRVLAIISPYTSDVDILCAAVLHDVVEDTDATPEQLTSLFGADVSQYVTELTDISKPEDGNRAARKKIDRQHIAQGSDACHLIKCADLIDNSASVIKWIPNFAPVYINEKKLLLEVLRGAPPDLVQHAFGIIHDYEEQHGGV